MAILSSLRVRLDAPNAKSLRKLIREKNYDVCHGSFRSGPQGASVDAYVEGKGPPGENASRLSSPQEEIGQGDRFADGTLPRGFGVKK